MPVATSQALSNRKDKQYTESSIRNYEIIFGKQFVATGGLSATKRFTEMLSLKPNELVLDFGSGLGGSAFYMAYHYGVTVWGIDASENMISRANKYILELDEEQRKKVRFELCDGTTKDFPEATFDCIYSRETLVHIEDKTSLLKKFHKWLKPGGRLLISDYCLGDLDSFSDDFKNYIHSRKYFMKRVCEYASIFENVGFHNVKGQDLTQDCIQILKKDAEALYVNKHEILNNLTRCEYDELVTGWDLKLQRCVSGNQAWGLFTATK